MKELIYLDNAATTFPKPDIVYEKTLECMKDYCGNPGRGGHYLSVKAGEAVYETREELSSLFHGKPENTVFTMNTTYAINTALKSKIKPGDHVIISNLEHNSVFRPVAELASRKIIEYDIFDASAKDDEILLSIKRLIKNNTAVIICTHASNICNRVLPIRRIGYLCKELGLYFIVDGAQSAGHYRADVDEWGIDAFCLPSHKGLYGPQGGGAIIFGSNSIPGMTFIEGGGGINSKDYFMPDFLPERYEAGTLPTPQIVGLCSGIKWVKEHGVYNLTKKESLLRDKAVLKLSRYNDVNIYEIRRNGPILLFNIEGLESSQTASELNKRNICVRGGIHCSPLAHKTINTPEHGAVRVSFGAFNTEDDVYALIEAVDDIIKNKPL